MHKLDPHLRQMEMDANRDGSMCLRDFEDMLKKENTIYYEHLQKGENKMSTKDWKNKEVTQLLAEAWGFKFNTLEEFNEFNGSGEVQEEEVEAAAETVDESAEEPVDETVEEEINEEEDTLEEGDEEELDENETLEEGEDEELDEAAKPDYIDIDGDGDKEESMKDAAEDKKEKTLLRKRNQLRKKLKQSIARVILESTYVKAKTMNGKDKSCT